jgi:hypothetical protein
MPPGMGPVGREVSICRRTQSSTMITLRICPALAVLATVWFSSVLPVRAAVPEYKLGEIASEDVITPVQLQVVNPDATEALKEKVAQQVPTIVRHTLPAAAEAEADLRASIATARTNFMAALTTALNGRSPVASDLDSAAYVNTLRQVGRESAKFLPLSRLAPMWVRGTSDEPLVDNLLEPMREVMAQPIVADKMENSLPPNRPVELIAVQNQTEIPTMQDLESAGVTVTVGKVISLGRARRVVETYFPSGQEELGSFVAEFVRTNAYPAPGLSEILRAKRLDGVTVNDTYEAAQVIVKKGQTIDRKALSALAAAREKSLISALQTKLDQEQTVAGRITQQTKWLAAGLAFMGVVLVLIFRRLRPPPGTALVPVPAGYQSLPGGEQPALPGEPGNDGSWRERAMAAEAQAARAQEAIRAGALGMMREKVFQTLSSQRAELLSAQQRAEEEMRELELRLEQLHTPLQERIVAYEKRIEELEQDLAAKGEENRELIGARINVAKQQQKAERGRFEMNWC